MTKVVVVGAGLSGLVSAIRLRRAGLDVTLVTKGVGGIQLGQGTVDVLGYAPERIDRPVDAIASYGEANPQHPYATLTGDDVRNGVEYLRSLVPDLLVGDLEHNYLLPTPVGAIRPTALVQPSMLAGECVAGKRMVLVGLRQMKDFWPELIAGNLSRTDLPGGGRVVARPTWLDLPAREGEVDSSPLAYARALDDPAYRVRFVAELKKLVREDETIGLPGVLGFADHEAWRDIQNQLGQPVFEISTIPPSVPGMRINDALTKIAKAERVRIVLGSQVLGAVTDDRRITALRVSTTGRPTDYPVDQVVFAPGGFESGALAVDSYITLSEPALGLPVWRPDGDLVVADHNAAQPLFTAGIRFDLDMLAVDHTGKSVYDNLRVAGGILAGALRWREKSGEGIALASAVRAADSILRSI